MDKNLLSKEDLQLLKWQDGQLFNMINDFYALVEDYYNMETETVEQLRTRSMVFYLLEKQFDDIISRVFTHIDEFSKFDMKKAEYISGLTEQEKTENVKKIEDMDQESQINAQVSYVLGKTLATMQKDIHLIERDEQVYKELEKDMYHDEDRAPLTIADAISYNINMYNKEMSRIGKTIEEMAKENDDEPNV